LNNGRPFFSKDSLVRIPIRLGEDAFTDGVISDEKREKLVNAMIGFKYIIDAYKPVDFMACATAAMREASNSEEIISEIKEKSGIELEVINGRKEAEIICFNHIEQNLSSTGKSYLHIDVGGGSTEMTLFSKGKTIVSESFNIGAVRIIKEKVTENNWNTMKSWVKEQMKRHDRPIEAIGSGGNINKIYKFAGKKDQTYMSYKRVEKIFNYLNSFSFDERIRILNLHTDRADVIIPAASTFLKIMKWGKIEKIHVPQIGLADGLVRSLYQKHNVKQEF
ncbi:MAG: ethanolamine ammonia-lyase reactivating factor EutA, partial [Desulfamplus sp.]|nr:ethanolamine ammonia-lyase reactivating factor EutA [Desulfamplus sp.]